MGKLTALKVKAAPAGRHEDGDGLALLVKATGTRSWVLKVQVEGKRREFGLGSAKAVSLAEARDKADAVRRQYRAGLDPVAEKQQVVVTVPTFREAARLAHGEQQAGWRNPKHRAQWLSSLEAYAFPSLGGKTVDKIDGPMIRDALLPIWLDKPETARRVRQRIGAVLDWAYAKGHRASEAPMRSLSKGLPRQPKKDGHFAALPYDKLPGLMQTLGMTESIGRLALQFLILTAARSGEVRGARWSEVDMETAVWTVPPDRMKAGKQHLVPLSKPALVILKRMAEVASDELVFPGITGRVADTDTLGKGRPGALTRAAGKRPMSDMTLTKVLRTAGADDATVHGMRSSFRDWAAEQTSFPGEVVEAALAHTIGNKVEAAYRRTNYLEKRRGLMDAWAAFIG
ncbi:MAG: integrase [Sphingomonas sp.]|uniref:tyrosine-type recombinase/integrase n=1 Tax=Sphingomonas sp. TaxID=28214 RepID=UPI000DBC2057|nr:integrase arm-type DNA-binding domain-containing protein [Sphingomonas sp.]PZU77496.1 MAG: integrase [Sphingomonas sp.]